MSKFEFVLSRFVCGETLAAACRAEDMPDRDLVQSIRNHPSKFTLAQELRREVAEMRAAA